MASSETMVQNNVSNLLEESVQCHNQNESFVSSEDSNSLFVESTIIELEELMGNEEEFKTFIESVSKEESPCRNKPFKSIQNLDLNCNEVKDTSAIPVIDICSTDDSDLEECSARKTEQCATFSKSPTSILKVISPKSEPSVCEKESELLSLGVKNVWASFLPETCNSAGVLTPECLPLSTPASVTLHSNDSNEDENTLSSVSDEGNLPSPDTEEILLKETYETVRPLPAEALPTASSECGKVETACAAFELDDSKSLAISLPSPPPACELEDLEDETSAAPLLPPAPCSESVTHDGVEVEIWQESCEPVSTIPTAPINGALTPVHSPDAVAGEFQPSLASPAVASDLVGTGVPCSSEVTVLSDSDFQFSHLPFVELIPDSATCDKSGSISAEETPSWAKPWVSTDDAENADNNDPEWDLLKKLETDEERYRVVREKWRQLSIPDPRVDLTRHNFRRGRRFQASRMPLNATAVSGRQSRKRARSYNDSDNEEHPSKRRRMFSCTQMFDNKINFIRHELDDEFEALKAQHDARLTLLSEKQQQQQNQLMYSTAPHHIVRRQFEDLAVHQVREVDDLKAEFEDRLHHISQKRMKTIDLLQDASEEVLTFNKFYTDLEGSDDDHCNITEEEFQQFEETEQMYELFNQIYSG